MRKNNNKKKNHFNQKHQAKNNHIMMPENVMKTPEELIRELYAPSLDDVLRDNPELREKSKDNPELLYDIQAALDCLPIF